MENTTSTNPMMKEAKSTLLIPSITLKLAASVLFFTFLPDVFVFLFGINKSKFWQSYGKFTAKTKTYPKIKDFLWLKVPLHHPLGGTTDWEKFITEAFQNSRRTLSETTQNSIRHDAELYKRKEFCVKSGTKRLCHRTCTKNVTKKRWKIKMFPILKTQTIIY